MATSARINYSIHNSLSLLNPFCASSSKAFVLKNGLHFRQNIFFNNASSARRTAMLCTCSVGSENSHKTDSDEPFVLTTPFYHVNAPPHMGSAYTTIAVDDIARFQRLLGKKVIFITDTDEHGEKIATAASARGSTPSEHCEVISQAYKALWKDLDISYDRFIRTTDPKHEALWENSIPGCWPKVAYTMQTMRGFTVSTVRSIRMKRSCLETTVVPCI